MNETKVEGVESRGDAIDVRTYLSPRAEAALSRYARRVEGSSILKIAGEIREMLARGEPVLNLTVGDFRPDQFPSPPKLREYTIEALKAGHTNYPPVNGVLELREAVRETARADHGLDYPLESILIGGGARCLLYASYMTLVDPGDVVVYPVPSWNTHHYVYLAAADGKPLPVTAEKNFHLDREDIAPYLKTARLLSLNSPLNPTGTCISAEALGGMCEAIVAENRRREGAGERPLFVVYDQVYHSLTLGSAGHVTPVGLVPEMAPTTILVDAVSKGMCGTGLRVGWALGPPDVIAKMTEMAGHFGAWAPRPEQMGTARFLRDGEVLREHREQMNERLRVRFQALDEGFTEMRRRGLPVEHVRAQGAMYLSVRFALIGRQVRGREIRTTEDLRAVLLREAGFAVIPFAAFGLEREDGWVRISVGAVSVEEIHQGLARVRELLEDVN
jgi:aspartate aminotransferase